jgi:hypothetical protein
MARTNRYTVDQVIQALKDTKGMVYLTAQVLKCTANTVFSYCERYPAVEQAKHDARGEMLDICELKLFQAVQKGEPWAIAFCLKTLGKDRGYVEKHEVAGKDGGALVLHVVYEDAPDLPRPEIFYTPNGCRENH